MYVASNKQSLHVLDSNIIQGMLNNNNNNIIFYINIFSNSNIIFLNNNILSNFFPRLDLNVFNACQSSGGNCTIT